MKQVFSIFLVLIFALELSAAKYEWKDFPILDSLPANDRALPPLDLSGWYNFGNIAEAFAIRDPKIVNLSNAMNYQYRPVGKCRISDDEYIIFYRASGYDVEVFISLIDDKGNIAESLLIYHKVASWLRTAFQIKGNEIAVFSYSFHPSSETINLYEERYEIRRGFKIVDEAFYRQ